MLVVDTRIDHDDATLWSQIDSLLHGGHDIDIVLRCRFLADSPYTVERQLLFRLVLGILGSIYLSVSHAIKEYLQIGITTGSKLLTVCTVVRIQPHLSLIGIRQSVAICIDNSTVVAVHLQSRKAGDIDFLVVSSIITLVECYKLIVRL
jgi:hypothetical protein